MRPSQAADQVRGGGAAVAGLAARARQASVDAGAASGRCRRRRVGAVVRRGAPRRDPADGHRRHRTAPRRGLRRRALRGGDGQRRLSGAARHRRGLGGGQHRRRHGARRQRDHPASAGPVLRRRGRPLGAARRDRRDAAGLPARDRRDGVRGRRPARRPQRPLPRRERAGASWVRTADAVGAPAAVVGAIVDRDVPAATDVVTSLLGVNEPAGRLRRAAGWRRPSPRRPVRSRSRPSWTRPSRSSASGCARAARPDGRPHVSPAARPGRPTVPSSPWRLVGSIPSACRRGSGPRR